MPEHRRTRLLLVALAVAVSVLAVAVAVFMWRPLPERRIVMASGPEGGAYLEIAAYYRDVLARNGIELVLRPSAGTVENLALLRNPASGVDVAFVQGGLAEPDAYDEVVSLGAVFYEPIWLFMREELADAGLAGLVQGRISVGPAGSGSREISLGLLELNGVVPESTDLVALDPIASAAALQAGEIDAVVLVAAGISPIVLQLALTPGVHLASWHRADAYVARFPNLTKLTLPMGVADFAANRPPHDVTLVAPTASLAVRKELHPALQYLLVEAAEEIHGRPGVFHAAGRFPAAEEIDLPLSQDARHFYLNGPSFLQRHLPFWMAQIVQQVLLVLLPLIGILYPVWSGLPKLYRWQMQRRVYRLYGELKWIERELHGAPEGGKREELMRQLDDLEERVFRMRLPNAYSAMGYTFKMHIRALRTSPPAVKPAGSGSAPST